MRIAKAPLPSVYQTEFYFSEIIRTDTANWFQNLIGILNCITELGHIKINKSVAQLSTFLVNPRAGHLRSALHKFSYLKHYDRYKLVSYPIMPRDSGNFN